MNDNSDLPILGQNVDKSQVPPIEQKRMVAFINHFIVNTVSFLNEFLTNVESKFVEFESKLQTIEASLQIVEAKMASIPDIGGQPKEPAIDEQNEIETSSKTTQEDNSTPSSSTSIPSGSDTQTEPVISETDKKKESNDPDASSGVKAIEDARYRKYFKMLQVGVPAPAVKLKMTAEGVDPNVLDDPNRVLEDGVPLEDA